MLCRDDGAWVACFAGRKCHARCETCLFPPALSQSMWSDCMLATLYCAIDRGRAVGNGISSLRLSYFVCFSNDSFETGLFFRVEYRCEGAVHLWVLARKRCRLSVISG